MRLQVKTLFLTGYTSQHLPARRFRKFHFSMVTSSDVDERFSMAWKTWRWEKNSDSINRKINKKIIFEG